MGSIGFVLALAAAANAMCEPVEQPERREVRLYHSGFPIDDVPGGVEIDIERLHSWFPSLPGDGPAEFERREWCEEFDETAGEIPVIILPDLDAFVEHGGKVLAALRRMENGGYIRAQSLTVEPDWEGYGVYYRAEPGAEPTKTPPMAIGTPFDEAEDKALDRTVRSNRFVGRRLVVNNFDWGESRFQRQGKGEFFGRVRTFPIYENVWLSVRHPEPYSHKAGEREIMFPLLDANGPARHPATDPYREIRNGPYQNIVLSEVDLRNWGTHSELVVPEPADPNVRRAYFHERIAIPFRLRQMDPPVFAFTKLESWKPGAEDLRFHHHPRPGELDNLRMVIIFSNISREALKEAVGSLFPQPDSTPARPADPDG